MYFECKLFRRSLLPLLSVLLFFPSCVDDGYDLSDLDTDDLYLGDHWKMPLGKAVISAAEILDVDNIDELSADANGDYIARYSDIILATLQGDPALRDRTYSLGGAQVGFLPAGSGGAVEAVISVQSRLPVEGNQYVEDFYRAEFTTGPSTSLMRVTMDLTQLYFNNSYGELKIELPSAFEVDENYLLAGTTGQGNIVRWVFPLDGNLSVSTTIPVKVIDTTEGDNINIDGKISVPSDGSVTTSPSASVSFEISFEALQYEVIYGIFDLDFNFSPTSAKIGGLYDIFEGEGTILSFRDPHIIIHSESTLGLPVLVDLEISPDATGEITQVDRIVLPPSPAVGTPASADYWIGESNPNNGYDFAYAPSLASVIRDARESIYVSGAGQQGDADPMFYPRGGEAELRYTVEIPFAPAKEFYAVTTQVIADAFDGDIRDYLFDGGTAELYGTVTNSLPLSFQLEMIITDRNGDPVGITFPSQDIAAPVSKTEPSVSKVSFPFSESDMERMENASDIQLRFVSYGTDNAPSLNSADQLVMDLKISKTGGIHISSDEDE